MENPRHHPERPSAVGRQSDGPQRRPDQTPSAPQEIHAKEVGPEPEPPRMGRRETPEVAARRARERELYARGESYPTIAEEVGRPVGTVKFDINFNTDREARKELQAQRREALGQEDIPPTEAQQRKKAIVDAIKAHQDPEQPHESRREIAERLGVPRDYVNSVWYEAATPEDKDAEMAWQDQQREKAKAPRRIQKTEAQARERQQPPERETVPESQPENLAEEVGESREQTARELLTEEELEPFIQNHEGRALILASMQPNEDYGIGRLSELLIPSEGDQQPSSADKTLVRSWCERVFIPAQLVGKKNLGPKQHVYLLKEKDAELGKALYGHELGFSEDHPEISLTTLLGEQPATRIRIFKEMVETDEPIRQTDFINNMQEKYPEMTKSGIQSVISTLDMDGIITYESEPYTSPKYVLPSEGIQTIPEGMSKNSLIQSIFEVLPDVADSEFSETDIYDALTDRYRFYRRQDTEKFTARISTALKRLKNENVVDVVHKTSQLTLSDEQRATLSEFVGIIDRFRTGDPEFLAEGRQRADEITADPERVSALFEKAKKASPKNNRISSEEGMGHITEILAENPHTSLSVQEIQESFGEKTGRNLTVSRIEQLVRMLQKRRAVRLTDVKNKSFYSLRD